MEEVEREKKISMQKKKNVLFFSDLWVHYFRQRLKSVEIRYLS